MMRSVIELRTQLLAFSKNEGSVLLIAVRVLLHERLETYLNVIGPQCLTLIGSGQDLL